MEEERALVDTVEANCFTGLMIEDIEACDSPS